ncbi:MAG: hypothetical protein KJZ62_04430 [Fimbriimonadaceae bacterium]|nr:hypothetical protein [Fimbriimonadaceae bacterium]QOJ11145.1 MAG: hypothetical protein HRU74_03435 [Chthonomonadaceae bacterium]
MSLEVLAIGGASTLQDGGRYGWRHYGVPRGGAFDRHSMGLANALCGNDSSATALEMLGLGGRFRAQSRVQVAWAGCIARVSAAGRDFENGGSATLEPGDLLEVGPFRHGNALYLATPGGWIGREVLGSASGLRVARGQTLGPEVETPESRGRTISLDEPSESLACGPIRCLPTPEALLSQIDALCQGSFTVRSDSDRRGIRLRGPTVPGFAERSSTPVCEGCVQLTASGELLMIGPDGPTLGGYPRVAVVCGADLDRIGQSAPGSEVEFEFIDLDAAISLREELEAARSARLRLAGLASSF